MRRAVLGLGVCALLASVGLPAAAPARVPDAGANAGLEAVPLPDDAAHLHLAGYALLHPGSRPAARAMLADAAARGIAVSVDPSSTAPLLRAGAAAFFEWIAGVQLLLPNRDEAAALTGMPDPKASARALAAHAREVVVKLGADGALWTDGARVAMAPAFPVPEADTTGAGDAFAAGLLAARLAGADAADALGAGCALAAEAVSREGGR